MENLRLLDLLIIGVSSLLGWWGKVLWDTVHEHGKTLQNLESKLPLEYVRKTEYDRESDKILDEIRALRADLSKQFDDIWREMRSKADK